MKINVFGKSFIFSSLLIVVLITSGWAQTISFSPNSGMKGTSFQVTVTGSGNFFIVGTTTCVQVLANPSTLSLSSVNVTSTTTLTGMLSIPVDHTVGTYNARAFQGPNCTGTQFNCTNCFTIQPCSTVVTNSANTGSGSLRAVLACAEPQSTITFAGGVNNQTISIALPVINVDKEITLSTTVMSNITLSASDPNNTQALFNISQPVYINGVKMQGNTTESLILNVSGGGSLNLENTDLDKVIINNN